MHITVQGQLTHQEVNFDHTDFDHAENYSQLT